MMQPCAKCVDNALSNVRGYRLAGRMPRDDDEYSSVMYVI